MAFFSRIFPPKELRAALGIFEEVRLRFDTNEAFKLIETQVKKEIFSRANEIISKVSKGISPREAVYVFVANIAGDHVESGHYHIYRGVLNPMEYGDKLLKLFDEATDELKKIGSWTEEQAEKQKKAIRDNLKQMG